AAVARAIKGDAVTIHIQQRFQPPQDLIVLGDNKGKERRFDRVGLAAEPAVTVFAAVQVVRREGDETALCQRSSKIVVGGVVRVKRIAWYSVATMLADDDGPTLARFQVLGQHQDPPG